MNRSIVVIACGCFMLVSRVTAQIADTFDPLRHPSGRMLCQPLSVGTADSAQVVLRFFDAKDEAELRETLVGYDSAGAPLYLTVFAQEMTVSGKTRVHAIVARFGTDPFGGRSLLGDETGDGSIRLGERGDTTGIAIPGSRLLTAVELDRARLLAVWIWNLPCRHGPPQEQ